MAIRFGVETAGSAWGYVPTTATQVGLGFLVLVLTEAARRETDQDNVLYWGRLFGAVVILAVLASGLRAAFQSADGEFLAFLETVTRPIGVGLILVVSAEAIRRDVLHRSDSGQALDQSSEPVL